MDFYNKNGELQFHQLRQFHNDYSKLGLRDQPLSKYSIFSAKVNLKGA